MRLRPRISGFTLIELLVVIAIIAVLAAILFPVFLSARAQAEQQKCLQNLHQLATAMLAYADSNAGRLPNARVHIRWPSWEGSAYVGGAVHVEQGQIFSYVKNKDVYFCPGDRGRPAEQFRGTQLYNTYPLSYSMNFMLSWRLASAFRCPSKLLLLIHEDRATINDGDFNWASDLDRQSPVHYKGTSVVYADSHAAWQHIDRLAAARRRMEWHPGWP